MRTSQGHSFFPCFFPVFSRIDCVIVPLPGSPNLRGESRNPGYYLETGAVLSGVSSVFKDELRKLGVLEWGLETTLPSPPSLLSCARRTLPTGHSGPFLTHYDDAAGIPLPISFPPRRRFPSELLYFLHVANFVYLNPRSEPASVYHLSLAFRIRTALDYALRA